MGRPLRFRLPGVPQLITQRGHNRLPCFIDGADYSEFNNILESSAQANGCQVYALVLLPHAYWLLASPGDNEGVSRMMQRTGRCYVRYCNAKYRREGTLWASRYHACLVEPDAQSMQQCVAYLHQTPAREGVVAPESDWPWLILDESVSHYPKELSEAAYQQISSVLHQGLVWGSATFKDSLAQQHGIRTEPGRRGRPPRSSATTPGTTELEAC